MFLRCLSAILCLAALLPAQETIPSGTYQGQWTGTSSSGDIHLALGPDGKTATAGFTIDGQEVPCKVITLKIAGLKLELVYEFDLQGNKLQSAISGALTGKTLEGVYKTTAGDQPVDQGTWKATAK